MFEQYTFQCINPLRTELAYSSFYYVYQPIILWDFNECSKHHDLQISGRKFRQI